MSRISQAAAIALIGITGCFASAQSLRAEDFHGYDCTQDCSGHQAGYDWAERKGVDDASDCGGNSQSFIEGCEAYANEQGQSSARSNTLPSNGGDESTSDDQSSENGEGANDE